MECRKIQEKLHAYLEGAVSDSEARLIRGHLTSCPRCRAVLEEIKKTDELLRNLDQIEPPPWLSQRIMGRIREEAETRRGIADWLFRPLRVKVPLQALAFVLVVGLAVLVVYRENVPEYERARKASPSAGTVLKDHESGSRNGEVEEFTPPKPGRAVTQGARRKQDAPAPTIQSEPAMGASQETEKKATDSAGEPTETAKGLAPPALSVQREEHAEEQATTGAIRRDEGRTKSKAFQQASPSPTAKSEKATPLTIALKSQEAEDTARQITGFLKTIEARHIATESKAGAWVVTADVKKDNLPLLFEMLKLRGAPRGVPAPTEEASPSTEVPIRIEITSP